MPGRGAGKNVTLGLTNWKKVEAAAAAAVEDIDFDATKQGEEPPEQEQPPAAQAPKKPGSKRKGASVTKPSKGKAKVYPKNPDNPAVMMSPPTIPLTATLMSRMTVHPSFSPRKPRNLEPSREKDPNQRL